MNGSLALLVLACAQTPASEPSSARFAARYDFTGLEFAAEPDSTLRLGAVELRRGARSIALHSATPREEGAFTLFERAPGVLERFERSEAGIEHSLVIDGPLGGDGDLVVRVEVGGTNAELGERLADGTHTFGAISYGRLFGIDANGERTDGDVRLVPGGLELVIDDAWLDAAAWPITLDPLVSSTFVVSDPPYDAFSGQQDLDSNSDSAFDDSSERYLTVFARRHYDPLQFEWTSRVRARRLYATGAPLNSEFDVSADGGHTPHVASVNGANRLVITWLEDDSDETRLRLRTMDLSAGTLSSIITLATYDLGDIEHHDIAGEAVTAQGVGHRAFVVWNDSSGVKLAIVSVGSTGQPSVVSTNTLVADTDIFANLEQVTVSRTTNGDGRMALAWVRAAGISNSYRIDAAVFDRTGTLVTTPITISGSNAKARNPSIDGGGTVPARWIAAWDNGVVANQDIDLNAVALTGAFLPFTNSLLAGPVVELANSLDDLAPSVGWRPGVAFIAYRERDDFVSGANLVLVGVDAKTAQVCEPASVASDGYVGTFNSESGGEAAVCMRTSGGDTSEHAGLLTYTNFFSYVGGTLPASNSISGFLIDAFDPNATVALVAFGCGSVGAINVPTPPAIANPDFRIELTNADPSSTIAILNIAAPQPFATCGACWFAPLEQLHVLPIVGGAATRAFAMPCNPALAGAQADVQWIVYRPGVAPCAPVPDFGATAILRLTVN